MERLFVYGTLAPGQPNHHRLQPLGGAWAPAKVKGVLHAEGWGAALGCPGIVLDPTGDDVSGFVLSTDALKKHWPELDRFEGAEYERVLAEARLEDQQRVEAYVYVLKR